MFKKMMGIVAAVMFGVMCVGCSQKDSVSEKLAASVETEDDVAAAQTASIREKLNGWWLCESDYMRRIGMDKCIIYVSEDECRAYYETPSGNFWCEGIVDKASISESDIAITGKIEGGTTNHFYLTSDSNGEDVLVAKDIAWDGDGNYIAQYFSRCDETIIEGKTYIQITQPTNFSY